MAADGYFDYVELLMKKLQTSNWFTSQQKDKSRHTLVYRPFTVIRVNKTIDRHTQFDYAELQSAGFSGSKMRR